MTRRKKGLIGILISLVLLVCVGLTGGAYYMFHFAFEPVPKQLSKKSTKSDELTAKNKRWLASVKKQTWTETSATDHLKLDAVYVPAKRTTDKTIVVAHGYMNQKEDMAQYIHMFHNLGYNVLAPDDRASGKSQGKYITFGWSDRLDYVKWTKQVIARNGSKSKIALFGVSMGGATVMMTAGEKLPSQVKAVVEDCGYSGVGDELGYELNHYFHLPKFPLLNAAELVAAMHIHYNFMDAKSTTALSKNQLPVFFIHGGNDQFVPTKMVYQNYKATQGYKQIWVVKKAGHAQSYMYQPKTYTHKVDRFLGKFL
ncbi:alpha/beta hydrolase [Levilactobacillus bambusae]|uniref:Alpha/beta hydrolase n=1 Tax=Levilactobacillus bambusae TaxID=2024736 RepID=A0A2V1N1N1_9LACO|nr:alpha/beta hydrolase [Levilactobacillus bambusae]PWG00200.1 alpha/beta hydrolase [Levilactobacillus bambusae]